MTRTQRASRRKANFVPDHYQDPTPQIDTGRIETVGGAALFSFADSTRPAADITVPEPDDLPPPMPESTTDAGEVARLKEKDTITALKRVFDVFTEDGMTQGRDTMDDMTPDNHFRTRYPGTHSDVKADGMDGKLIGLKIMAGLETFNKLEDDKTKAEKEIEAEGRWVLDALNDSAARLLSGEPTEEVEASREKLRKFLLRELELESKPGRDREPRQGEFKTGTFRYVRDKYGHKTRRRITAEDRKKRLSDPDEVKALVETLRLRSR